MNQTPIYDEYWYHNDSNNFYYNKNMLSFNDDNDSLNNENKLSHQQNSELPYQKLYQINIFTNTDDIIVYYKLSNNKYECNNTVYTLGIKYPMKIKINDYIGYTSDFVYYNSSNKSCNNIKNIPMIDNIEWSYWGFICLHTYINIIGISKSFVNKDIGHINIDMFDFIILSSIIKYQLKKYHYDSKWHYPFPIYKTKLKSDINIKFQFNL